MGFPMTPSVGIIIHESQLKSNAQAGVREKPTSETWGQPGHPPMFVVAGNPGERPVCPRIFLA